MVPTQASSWPSPRRKVAPLLVAGSLALSVCYHEMRPCETPPPFYVTFQAGTELNPDEHHRPLPTQFLVLQLRSTAKFEKASFDDLWQHPKETLGDELVQSNEVSVAPGATVTTGFPRHAQATVVGVVGVFRSHTGESWRAVAPLPGVPGDKCGAETVPIKPSPSRDDVVLKFHGNVDSIENRTPPPVSRGCA
jgi:type VI secretion system protein VasD